MRILKISDVYFPRINGVSTSIQTFWQEFVARDHHVHLIAPAYPASDAEQNLTRVTSRGVPLDPEDRMMRYRHIGRLADQFAGEGFDLVHIHTPFVAHYAGIKLAKSLRIPCVVTYHTLFEEYLYHYIPYISRRSLRFLARRFSCRQCNQVDGIIAPSSAIVNVLQDYGVSAPIEIIPTGIHSQRFQTGDRQRFLQKFDLPADRPILLNVSRVAFEKNIALLLDTLAVVKKDIPNVLLIIAGEGPAKSALIKHSQKLGIEDNVRFVGYLDRSTTLVDCYACADLFVFSSTTETQGLVLLESMAAGTPVVSVAAMGTTDVLDGYDERGITDGSVANFAGKIIHLLTHPMDLAELSQHAVQHAFQWDASELAEKMLEFYTKLLSEHKS